MSKQTKQYTVTLSNGETLRIITSDFKKAFKRADAWAKKQEDNVTVANVVEVN